VHLVKRHPTSLYAVIYDAGSLARTSKIATQLKYKRNGSGGGIFKGHLKH
jgi:hypothetical protein